MRRLLLCALLLGCQRETRKDVTRTEEESKAPESKAPVASKTFVQRPEPPSPPEPESSTAKDAEPPPDPPPKLGPFLSVVAPVAPTPAPAKGYLSKPPAGFDVRKGGDVYHLADGDLYANSFMTGPSNSEWFLSLVRGGVEVKAFPQVWQFTLDPERKRLALHETRTGPGGPLRFREILDLTTLTSTPLPHTPCTDRLAWVDDGKLLLGDGFVHDPADHPETSQVWVCLFDSSGKLLAKLDGGRHPHHAAAENYVNALAGVLPKDPSVVFLFREYRSHGNYDVTFIDTHPPHTRKIARLNTPAEPGQMGSPKQVEMDLATMTLATATELRFRGKKYGESWWWQWQTTKLVDAP